MTRRFAGTLLLALALAVGSQFRPAGASAQSAAPAVTNVGAGVVAPWSHLIQGADHNLYGTTHDGGAHSFGSIYRIMPGGGSTMIYSFPNRSDGTNTDAPLIQGSDGRLYGTTYYEGGSTRCGTVFTVNTDGTGFQVIHTFSDADGCNSWAGLLEGDDGNLYGVAYSGGPNHLGDIYRMALDGSGFTILHTFTDAREGSNPQAALIQGTDGRLYGTTMGGGPHGGGIVFAIKPDGTGFTTVYGLGNGTDGATLRAGVTQGADGALYGATASGGQGGKGTIFKVKTDGSSFTVLHAFTGPGDGMSPHGELLQGSDGKLYGTTAGDGSTYGGSLFTIGTDGSGYSVLHTFVKSSSDGFSPQAGLLQADDGRLYGTTSGGGVGNNGTVFALSLGLPTPAPTIRAVSPTSGPTGVATLIHGNYFVGASAAGFNGATASPTVASSQWLRTTVPSSATTGPVSVTTPGGTGEGPNFTVLPSITGLSVASGKYGDTVTINGTSFASVKSVSFNGTPAVYTVTSPNQITTSVPQDSSSGSVTVVTADGTATSPSPFTVTSLPPTISISQVALAHTVKGQSTGTTSLKSGEKATFTVVYTAQNPGSHSPAATVTFLSNGKPMGSPVTMQAATALDGSTTFTASKSFRAMKHPMSLTAQLTVSLGPCHDSRTVAFTVSPAKNKEK